MKVKQLLLIDFSLVVLATIFFLAFHTEVCITFACTCVDLPETPHNDCGPFCQAPDTFESCTKWIVPFPRTLAVFIPLNLALGFSIYSLIEEISRNFKKEEESC